MNLTSDIKGKNIIITGGTSGLGYGLAKFFSASNKVFILSPDAHKGEEVSKELNCAHISCDITSKDSIETALKIILDTVASIDILINNAGVWLDGEVDEASYDDISKVINVNTLGTIYMTRAVVPYMKSQKFGTILNVVSLDGVICKKERSIYGASKWAITGFTHILRQELAKYNIRVMGIYPGLIKTALFEKAGVLRDFKDAMSVSDVVKVVHFLLSFNGDIVFDPVVFKDKDYE